MDKGREKNQFSDYFERLRDSLDHKYIDGFPAFCVTFCGKTVKFCFSDPLQMTKNKQLFGDAVTENTEKYTWTFYCIEDKNRKFIPAPPEKALYRGGDETGFLLVPSTMHMYGIDYRNKNMYCLYANASSRIPELITGGFVLLMFMWARQEKMFLIHGAAVGENGRGVFITESGGKGKSTLAVTCFLQGMQFTSDDYTIFSVDNELCAGPLTRTVKLMPDTYESLAAIYPELKKMPLIYENTSENGKLLLDASAFPFAESLPVRAVLSPVITEEAEPDFSRANPGKILTRMIYSTIEQMGVPHDPETIKGMAALFHDLPFFEIRLTSDYIKNAEYLRKFIQNL